MTGHTGTEVAWPRLPNIRLLQDGNSQFAVQCSLHILQWLAIKVDEVDE